MWVADKLIIGMAMYGHLWYGEASYVERSTASLRD